MSRRETTFYIGNERTDGGEGGGHVASQPVNMKGTRLITESPLFARPTWEWTLLLDNDDDSSIDFKPEMNSVT